MEQSHGVFYWLSVLIFSSMVSCVRPCMAESHPNYGTAPDFQLVDQEGEQFGRRDLDGKIWVANFIFTRCQGICPLMSGQFSSLQEKLSADAILVSFSVDPTYDTPKILSAYAARFKAQSGRWIFLTGKENVIRNLITEGFRLGVEKASDEDLKAGAEPVMHSNRFVLADQAGRIRGYYDASDPAKIEELVQAVHQLQTTKSESRSK